MQKDFCQLSSTDEEFTLAQQNNIITIKPTASLSTSHNIVKDGDLTWEEFMTSKAVFIPQLTVTQWPQEFVIMMADLFYNVEIHPTVITTMVKPFYYNTLTQHSASFMIIGPREKEYRTLA